MKKVTEGMFPRGTVGSVALVALLMSNITVLAAQPKPSAPVAPPSPRAEAPIDLTGYWVSIVTQDWLYRMVVPGKGEYVGVPINLAAKQFADAWSPAADEAAGQQCKAYGAAAIMRVPERLHITWQDDHTLRVDTDSGMQTRLLRFDPSAQDMAAAPSTQGVAVASWVFSVGAGGTPRDPPERGAGTILQKPPHFGSLKVTTTHMSPGYLRKNGIPYGVQATLLEYWEVYMGPDERQWMTIPSELEDPQYLQSAYDVAPIFRKEPDGSKWNPTPCSLSQ